MLSAKGHRVLIEAAPRVLARVPDTRFLFVGALENPPYEAELQDAIRAAGLEQHFQFTGWRRDLPDVIRAMDVIVMASTGPEAAPLAVMEAMAMARPVVASRTGGTPEIVVDGETGLLYEAGDAATMATHITRCLEDRDWAGRIGRAGRERVEQCFALDRHLAEIERLYESCRLPTRTR
jgi:glycosyltransferase involved in cell wall biosynthesis